MRYAIEYSADAETHLAALTAAERRRVFDEVDRQLVHQPTAATRNRKKLRANVLAEWELRLGNLRVYYLVRDQVTPVVSVVAVGRKVCDRLFIGGVEVTI